MQSQGVYCSDFQTPHTYRKNLSLSPRFSSHFSRKLNLRIHSPWCRLLPFIIFYSPHYIAQFQPPKPREPLDYIKQALSDELDGQFFNVFLFGDKGN